METLRSLADRVAVKDGGRWPVNPGSGQPICDRCEQDATRVLYSGPPSDSTAAFFCENCGERDACDPSEPLVRMAGDPNAPV